MDMFEPIKSKNYRLEVELFSLNNPLIPNLSFIIHIVFLIYWWTHQYLTVQQSHIYVIIILIMLVL